MPKGKPLDVTVQAPAAFWDVPGMPATTKIFGWGQLRIIVSPEDIDAEQWVHISVSCRNRYPTWDEILAVRYEFFKATEEVFQVFPPVTDYVNMHKFAFHLWHCANRLVLPLRATGVMLNGNDAQSGAAVSP